MEAGKSEKNMFGSFSMKQDPEGQKRRSNFND